ncbi:MULTISPECIES: hypothetical protein [Actinomycetaceae]|uniref:hypothetical protein n=1 Tax=Actinomycetaceae TaxID=2049 RepID=UPI0008A46760|nr:MULTISPECIES: hypothetical protein [Actinomycetaceae]MDP9834268.1 UDP-N-acetylmuramyl pentapeptide phosphotransferase/UDP-N-acetylglucosamine-1-phosphate transferase [Gleimia europaea]MDU4286833.1 beta-carotene 15,15'-monooxygenase [Actinomyces sp.]OFR32121.1 hypothetical protein HMPREF2891_02280 [Actinomyces sp. HMSC065F11]
MNSRSAIAFAGGVGAAALTAIVTNVIRTAPSLQRTNHAGEQVSLSEGVGAATALIGSAVARRDFAAAAALAATANAGLADDIEDLREDAPKAKGLAGHFEAFKRGNITTGAVKVAAIGSSATGYALVHCNRYDRGFYDWIIDSIIVAGSANIVNLFDLRPGRALKASAACSLIASASRVSPRSFGATLGTIVGSAPSDLAGKTMLGDVGANTLGLQVGMLAIVPSSRAFRTVMAALTLGVIGAGEVVSFSKLIESSKVLSTLDELGVKSK